MHILSVQCFVWGFGRSAGLGIKSRFWIRTGPSTGMEKKKKCFSILQSATGRPCASALAHVSCLSSVRSEAGAWNQHLFLFTPVFEIKSESIKVSQTPGTHTVPLCCHWPCWAITEVLHLHQSPSVQLRSIFIPAALLSSDGHMTLSDLHTHTSADKADTLNTFRSQWQAVSVSSECTPTYYL